MTTTALVVDDEVDLCRLMQITLTKMGIKSDVAYTLSQARSYWQDNDYDFCLTDLKLPDGSGLELVKEISNSSSTPIAVITAHGSMDLAIEALKLGAFDFVNKPLELPRLRQLVENALKVIHQDNEAKATAECSPEQKLLDSRLIGDSAVMHPLKNTILKLARSQAPVFLSGASGTGKEVVARLIHDLSPRRDGSFVPVNCGAIPSELMESEFFGHKKEKTVRAIGDTKEVPVDIRILSATHKNLNQLVQDGAFRQDLYYRINVIELKLPTLNARRDDIPVLAKHFLALIADEWQLENPPILTVEACERLQDHNFAGNVRELRNVLERAVTLAETPHIDISHLGLPDIDITHHRAVSQDQKSEPAVVNNTQHSERQTSNQMVAQSIENREKVIQSMDETIAPQVKQVTTNLHPYRTNAQHYPSMIQRSESHHAESPNHTARHNHEESVTHRSILQGSDEKAILSKLEDGQLPSQGLEHYLQEQEKQLIITALKQTAWNKTQAAELLGTTFRSLRYRMKKLEIAEDQFEP